MNEPRSHLRCAIYTRKSTEEGLEQEFNTLQAQRESAEAFIASQRQAGWTAVNEAFDDGGFSGASLERPALQRLFAGIEAGRIDCVVVYKVDRLSRSLLDFARLMSLFDRHGVSFVSVTQEFNTTTSLGRLTLNILLSFAQFEREIIGERTRDKLGAARRKGKWIGGVPVLGYDVDPLGGRLIVNQVEAKRVQEIYQICGGEKTLTAALDRVNARGLKNKDWTSRKGIHHVGRPFSLTTLRALLGKVLYKGAISHKGTEYAGEQPAIIEANLWARVNERFTIGKRERANQKQEALLAGLLYCGKCGGAMTLTHTRRHGRQYWYYACQGKDKQRCRRNRIGVTDLETALTRQLERTLGDQPSSVLIQKATEQVIYDSATRQVSVVMRDGARFAFAVAEPTRPGVRGQRRPETGRVPRISRLVALALKLEGLVREGRFQNWAEMAREGQVSRARLSQILSLLNLAPAIQETLLFLPKVFDGPDRLTERDVRPIARLVDWQEQERVLAALTGQSAIVMICGSHAQT
jgi:site-specific DNA recombinase